MEQFCARLSESIVQISIRRNSNADEGWRSLGTGFVVYSGLLNLGVPSLAQTNYTFVMTAANLFDPYFDVANVLVTTLNIRSTVEIRFMDDIEPHYGEILHVDRKYDLAIFYFRDERRRAALFFNDEYDIPNSTQVHCVSHPILGSFAQHYLFTSGQSSGICAWSPDSHLANDCICYTFDLCVGEGSSGAPIVDNNGRVLAVVIGSSGYCRNFRIGIGMRTIITFLLKSFKLPTTNVLYSNANQVLAECIANAQNAFLP